MWRNEQARGFRFSPGAASLSFSEDQSLWVLICLCRTIQGGIRFPLERDGFFESLEEGFTYWNSLLPGLRSAS